jgi:hypothetical protein
MILKNRTTKITAFTLVKLLVVVFMIIFLAVLSTVLQNNIHQIGMAVRMHASQNDNRLPAGVPLDLEDRSCIFGLTRIVHKW